MKIVTICNHKGGSGKTTCAIHIAAALGLSGHKALVLDLDPQGFLTRMVGLGEPDADESVLALFGMDASFDRATRVELCGFEVIPGSHRLTSYMKHLTQPTDVFWLKETLSDISRYDFILIDTSSAITVYTLNALVASDLVVIPVVPENLPVVGAEQTYKTVELVRTKLNPALTEAFFVLTQVDGRRKNHARFGRYLRKKYGTQVLRHVVRTSTTLADETSMGKTVFQTDMKSRGAIDFANITDELLQLMSNSGARKKPVGVSVAG